VNRPLSRREFCAIAGAGLVAFQLPGCGEGAPASDGGAGDLAQAPTDLLPPPGSDLAGASCGPASSVDGGPESLITSGQARFTQAGHFFVCRDAAGLYALTSVCTHQGCDVGFVSESAGFECPCHGSQYDFQGRVTRGPAPLPLDHLAVCVAADGEVFVDPNTVVPTTKRL
jgi:Rieske Fe-S protein